MTDLVAFVMDGAGGAREVAASGIRAGQGLPEGGFVWVNVNFGTEAGAAWLQQAGLDAMVLAALVAEETRPRCTFDGEMTLLNLRGVNLNPGSEPEDMVSVRLCVSASLVVTSSRRNLSGLTDLIDAVRKGNAPAAPGELVARLALRLADRAEPVVATLSDRIDDLEEAVSDGAGSAARRELADVRRVSTVLRRYMFPQRDALSTLEVEDPVWLRPRDRSRVREATERVTRLAEELDALRDRAQVVRDQIVDIRAEAMNRQMLILAVVTTIFAPLSLITGLLGINVAGIPGAENPVAFWGVCGLLVVTAAAVLLLFRRSGIL